MSKIDDMRRQREARFAPEQPKAARKTSPALGSNAGNDVEGRCPSCGNLKAMQNGLLVSHQKGLGNMCGGSRQPPA